MIPGLTGDGCTRFVAAALGLFLIAASAHAQQPLQITPATPAPAATAVAPEAAKGARQEELEKVQAEQKKNAEVAAKLKAEIDAIGEDRRKLNALLIGSARPPRDNGKVEGINQKIAGLLGTSPDQILIKNHAIAINPIDGKLQYHAIYPIKYPTILGQDVAGEVVVSPSLEPFGYYRVDLGALPSEDE